MWSSTSTAVFGVWGEAGRKKVVSGKKVHVFIVVLQDGFLAPCQGSRFSQVAKQYFKPQFEHSPRSKSSSQTKPNQASLFPHKCVTVFTRDKIASRTDTIKACPRVKGRAMCNPRCEESFDFSINCTLESLTEEGSFKYCMQNC